MGQVKVSESKRLKTISTDPKFQEWIEDKIKGDIRNLFNEQVVFWDFREVEDSFYNIFKIFGKNDIFFILVTLPGDLETLSKIASKHKNVYFVDMFFDLEQVVKQVNSFKEGLKEVKLEPQNIGPQKFDFVDGPFLRGILHDLNNKIFTISASCESLGSLVNKHMNTKNELGLKLLQFANNCVGEVTLLTSGLRSLLLTEEEQKIEDVDLNEVLKKNNRLFSHQLIKYGIEYKDDINVDHATVNAVKLSRSLSYFVHHVISFLKEYEEGKRKLIFKAYEVDKSILLEIGWPLSSEDVVNFKKMKNQKELSQHIFSKYFQLSLKDLEKQMNYEDGEGIFITIKEGLISIRLQFKNHV